MANPVSIFSWGYWGWGNATTELVTAVDAVERERGFEPLLFVDIRWSRSVRAVGFRERSFENLVGAARYRWLRSLGNRAIDSSKGPKIQIADPSSVAELLELAVQSNRDNRHVLFFCACEWPREAGETTCHRDEVARLLQKEAKRRAIALELVEWPGGEPLRLDLPVSAKALHDVLRGKTTVPVDSRSALEKAAGLPHCSVARLQAPDRSAWAIVGPAVYRGRWLLPIHGRPVEGDQLVGALEREAKRRRTGWGLDPRFAGV